LKEKKRSIIVILVLVSLALCLQFRTIPTPTLSEEFQWLKTSPPPPPPHLSQASFDAAVAEAVAAALAAQPPAYATAPATTPRHDFREHGIKSGTDKVQGYAFLPKCLEDKSTCIQPDSERETCRTWGHFYDTIYDKWLAPYTSGDNPMQLLEIGFYQGSGFDTYTKFLSNNKAAELHSMEISCMEPGPRNEGKWPWGNFAEKHSMYLPLLKAERLHCGDANNFEFLKDKWETKMRRPDSPPLKVVIDDGSHLHSHMATSLFFWFPRIEPGGIMVVEDIQPSNQSNKFRTHIVPQVMKDLHWCGGTHNGNAPDSQCFPTIQPLLQGVHCELHICVFVRNDSPAIEPSKKDSMTPPNAFNAIPKCLFGPHE